MKKILITGGAGFIGINSARRFLKREWEVTLFDNFSRKGTDINVELLQKDFTSNVRVVRGDVRTDLTDLAREVNEHDVVLHLAAQVAVTTSVTDPRTDFEINALGTFNILEAVRLSKNRPFVIYSSTNKVFGALEDLDVREEKNRYVFEDTTFDTFGVPESRQLDFHSPYGVSKGVADQYTIDYSRIYGLKTVVFRQSCIYGTNQFGVEDQGWVAWFAIASMLGRPITLYGTGKQVRDILFIEDLVDLYERAIEKQEDVSGKAYNVGGGPENTLSLLELLGHLEGKYGYKNSLSYSNTRPGDQPIFIADIRKAQKDLGWSPKVSVSEGIERMHDWMQKNKEVVLAVSKM